MHNHQVFAVLTAYDQKDRAGNAFMLPENSTWFRPAVGGGIARKPIINSRQGTPADEEVSEDGEASGVNRLVVTFYQLLEEKNLGNGIQLGSNPTSSHILLGHRGTKGVSAKQCNITVDDNLCVWLHDYHSTYGTAVGYAGQHQKEVRKRETWILAYAPGTRNPFGEITIHSGRLALRIEFPSQTKADPQYIENLRAFANKCKEGREKSKEEIMAVGRLGLNSEPVTEALSEAPTVDQKPIYFQEKLIGTGAFGKVHRVLRVRDGAMLAAKTFKSPAKKRRLDEVDSAWLTGIRREFTLMEETPHPNIIQVFEFREIPKPMIVMDYYPYGNILDAGFIDEDEYISTFGQVLDGLSHLHAKGVVHRDLKPENFLVEKAPFKVVITDFGLSNVMNNDTLLTTFCGTPKYMAPEMFPGLSDGHGPRVDVWSLGVIVLELMHGIPTLPDTPQLDREEGVTAPARWSDWIGTWATQLSDRLGDEDDGQLIEILVHMIESVVRVRWSSKKCLAQGFENGLFKRRKADHLVICTRHQEELDPGSKTPTPSSPVVRTSLPSSGNDRDATIILRDLGDGEDYR